MLIHGSEILDRHRRSGSRKGGKATPGKRLDRHDQEQKAHFMTRKMEDVVDALRLGVSDQFREQVVPAYLRGDLGRGGNG